jgi:prepilin signal peptidase PulO-like enzyme (type II secretory pathway)
LAAFALLLLATMVSKGAMGMGDAKFGALGGIVTGISGVLVMLAAAFIVAGLIALAAMTVGSYSRRDVIPFTPFLVAGTILAIGAGTSHLSP